jgi:hypothetical protein
MPGCWLEFFDEEGDPYYYDFHTKTQSSERPPNLRVPPVPRDEKSKLLEEVNDPSVGLYNFLV